MLAFSSVYLWTGIVSGQDDNFLVFEIGKKRGKPMMREAQLSYNIIRKRADHLVAG